MELLHAGDIGAAAKMNEALTGDTLCSKEHALTMRGPLFPLPLYQRGDFSTNQGRHREDGADADPDVRRRSDAALASGVHYDRETILSGMGDAHVDTAVRRIQSRFSVGLDIATPKVPYKETVMAAATAQYRHKKQSGGAGQFAEVHMRIEPIERDAGFQYEWEVVGGRISTSFQPSVEKGVRSVTHARCHRRVSHRRCARCRHRRQRAPGRLERHRLPDRRA